MFIRRILSILVVVSFLFTSLGPLPQARADEPLLLPAPGTMVNLTPAFEPALIKGLTVDKDNPFRFNFIMDAGKSGLSGEALKKEGDRLVKYFFACLTIPEKDIWVNLSPYEKDRIISQPLGETPLGRDLLAQDYILKQLTASLIYPEKDLGKEFWDRVYAKAREQYGTSQIPVNTFNKVWILADKATVYEQGQTAFVLDGHLKVMLDEDYMALNKNRAITSEATNQSHSIASQVVRTIILPEIEKEVNQGKNFATLRQIFNSLILASWYKKNLKEALLNQVYADKSTVKGVNLDDPSVKEKIYQQYLKAYKKGVFNFIKEDPDPDTKEVLPRKYFSGGFVVDAAMLTVKRDDPGILRQIVSKLGTSAALFSLSVALSLNQPPALAATPSATPLTVTAPIVPLSDADIQGADRAMLSPVINSWSKSGLADLLTNVLTSLDGLGQPYGLSTTHTRDLIKYDQKSDIRSKLQEQISQLFGNDKNIGRFVIDGKAQAVINPTGQYAVSVISVDNTENLFYGKATGTSIEVYKRNGEKLDIVTSIQIQWGSDVRVLISTDEKVFDFRLQEDGELKEISPQGLQMENNGSFISLGGNTATWPDAMKAFDKERLSQIKTKERHSGSDVVDEYYMMSKVGLMTGWVSLSQAQAIAQLMSKANGLAKIQTAEGLEDVQGMTITEQDLLSDKQVYIYAGVHNLVEQAQAFINARSDKGVGISRTKPEENLKIDHVSIRETFQKYVESNLKIAMLPGLDETDRQRLEKRIKLLVNKIVDAFLNDISLEKVEHHEGETKIIGKLQAELTEKERVIFFSKNGVPYIHGLDWILKNMPNPGRAVGQNVSGDQQKLLDFVFNQILKYVMRLEVHAIISEEDDNVIYGSGESVNSTDSVRIVNFLDPIDGSSQIKEGGAFGSIFTFGYLKKGQSIEDGTFDPRTQLLASLDLSFGPNTLLTLINPTNAEHKSEIVQFTLTDSGGQVGFRRELEYSNMLNAENDNLKWEGLLPQADKNTALLLARGGSLQEAKVSGHRQFVQGLEDRYGVIPIYSGALASEMKNVLLAHDISGHKIAGAMYFYPSKKLRHLFEGIYYALMTSLTGAETIDGQQPLFNLPVIPQDGKSLSANSMPFYSGSSWMTKLMMTWSYYINQYSDNRGVVPTDEELNIEWGKFLKSYVQRTSFLIDEISKITDQSQNNVRKALLSWDSRDTEENSFPRLLIQPASEIAKKLTFDAAMAASAEEKRDVLTKMLAKLRKPKMVQGSEKLFGILLGNSSEEWSIAEDLLNNLPVRVSYGSVPGKGLFVNIPQDQMGIAQKYLQQDLANLDKAAVAVKPDVAMNGGIDLNTSNMTTTIRKEGGGVEMRFDAALVARIRKDGIQSLTPFIFRITPIRNIWSVFGMQAPQTQENLAAV